MLKLFNFLLTGLLFLSGGSPGFADQGLGQKIDKILSDPHLAKTQVSIKIVSLDDHKTVFEKNPDLPLGPASNTKLITGAAALSRIGPKTIFTTRFYTEEGIRNGAIQNLWIKGGGDPLFVTESLQQIIQKFHARHLKQIRGDIIIDDTLFDEKEKMTYVSPISRTRFNVYTNAFSYNFNRDFRFWWGTEPPDPKGAVVLTRKAPSPSLMTGEVLKKAFIENGIQVLGTVRRQPIPSDVKLFYTHHSPPLIQSIQSLNKYSNNFTAEQLVKVLGLLEGPGPGSSEKGLHVIEDYLEEIGIQKGTYVLENGSGLSGKTRFSASQFVTLLIAIQQSGQKGREFIASLSIAGIDGTLEDRFTKGELKGNLIAKTGSLDQVSALSGFFVVKRRPYVFSILINDFQGEEAKVKKIEEKILSALVPIEGSR
ncbi:MAG: D-alanyl-D-alanine carboxypeptidase/D-alanyl-D-alanine-endopeptidase [bacterium]|nr:D-alanyl-D-alanine carboxypeptidase/D-alanyl-D-alanine-endopeptidase [bacterium]